MKPSEAPLRRLHQAGVAADFFTAEATVEIPGAGDFGHLQGREQISEALRGARLGLNQLQVETRDAQLTLAPSKIEAVMNLTAIGHVNGERNAQIHLLRMNWSKTNAQWRISRIVSVQPFSP